MKKSTLILITIVYVASIVVISIFGMKTVIYNEVIPVTKVECLNETDERTFVDFDENGNKRIRVQFTEPGDAENLTGTMIQLSWRVTPDDASKKDVQFIYNENLTRVTFVKDDNGRDLGLILFSGITYFSIRIMATDGSRVYTDIVVWAY